MFKGKFPVLGKKMKYQPKMATKIIRACATLWNYGILVGDNAGYNPDTSTEIPDIFEDLDPDAAEGTEGGTRKRRELAQRMWLHNDQ